MSRPEVVLCDLDGTITDSFPGIDRCLRLALPSIGLDRLTDADIRAFLGPPLHYTLKEVYGKSDEDVARFVRVYRAEYFGGGEYEFTVFPGMADLLADIAASDMALVLATAKPIESAERVLVKAVLRVLRLSPLLHQQQVLPQVRLQVLLSLLLWVKKVLPLRLSTMVLALPVELYKTRLLQLVLRVL